MCTPSTPKATTAPKPDPLRVLLSRDKFNKSGGMSGYRLPAHAARSSTPNNFALPQYKPGLNTGI